MPQRKRIHFSPTQVLVLGFVGLIFIGSLLLMLPQATVGKSLTPLEALFTATSAVCVTGLVVVDTGTTFTFFGQIVLMLLIQAGGLGVMTMATIFFVILGKRISLKERLVIQEALNQFSLEGLVRLTRNIVLMALLIEGLGALILATRFIPIYGLKQGLWFGVFHSVSAFSNAGFDLIGNFRGLTPFVEDPVVTLTLATLFIIGGLGFTVIADFWLHGQWRKFSFHTKMVLAVSGALLLVGTFFIFILEYNNPHTLAPLSPGAKLWASFFAAATPRTAGFSTLDTASLSRASLFLTIVLMYIGASPCSTGGGIKTATFGTLILAIRASITGEQDVVIFKRRLAPELVMRSMTIAVLGLFVVVLLTMGLTITEYGADFLPLFLEATSAFSTAGISLGVTPSLTALGRLLVIVTMFAGRLGPMTVALALGRHQRASHVRYPEDKIMIG